MFRTFHRSVSPSSLIPCRLAAFIPHRFHYRRNRAAYQVGNVPYSVLFRTRRKGDIRSDIEQAKQLGSPIDFSAAANAAQQCTLLEDDLIFNGSTEFGLSFKSNKKGKRSPCSQPPAFRFLTPP